MKKAERLAKKRYKRFIRGYRKLAQRCLTPRNAILPFVSDKDVWVSCGQEISEPLVFTDMRDQGESFPERSEEE